MSGSYNPKDFIAIKKVLDGMNAPNHVRVNGVPLRVFSRVELMKLLAMELVKTGQLKVPAQAAEIETK